MSPSCDLYVVALDRSGAIRPGFLQALREFRHSPEPRLLWLEHGRPLIDVLVDDLGIVRVRADGRLALSYISTDDLDGDATRVLGRVAEAMVVRRCLVDERLNREWARVARRGARTVVTPDGYMPVGTGLRSTRDHSEFRISRRYEPQAKRDIVWVNRQDPAVELAGVGRRGVGSRPAGLQVKVSRNGMAYLTDPSASYEVPVVYFDLDNDFDRVLRNLRQGSPALRDHDLVRGRDIDPQMHEDLRNCWYLLRAVLARDVEIEELLNSYSDVEAGLALDLAGRVARGPNASVTGPARELMLVGA